jgi:uncharacterized cupin superfamily protein
MEILKQGTSATKPDGTRITYYVFPEYEIHFNEVPPNTAQPWHHHDIIEETIYIISGEVEVHWIEDDKKKIQKLYSGNIARVENSPHTLVNSSDTTVTFLVVRFVLSGKNRTEVFKSDKHLDQIG